MSGLILRLRNGDERVLFYVLGRRHPRLDSAVRSFKHAGDAAVTIGIVLVMLLLPQPEWHAAGRLAGSALALSHIAVQLLKRTIARPRPRLPTGAQSLIESPDRFSFPSGHAAAALSVALGLAAVAPLLLDPWILLAGLLVGISRCYLGVHYPGDVLAGWLLALGAFQITTIL